MGKVALWGRTIECEHGYRAEFAYPERVVTVTTDSAVAPIIARAYGVPCMPLESLKGGGFAFPEGTSFAQIIEEVFHEDW